MKQVVYKWGPLSLDKTIDYRGMPVHIGIQDGDIFMWTIYTEDDSYRNSKKAKLYGTGAPYTGKYLGTAITPAGFVWHAVEIS